MQALSARAISGAGKAAAGHRRWSRRPQGHRISHEGVQRPKSGLADKGEIQTSAQMGQLGAEASAACRCGARWRNP
jgi:hypothetical protein